MSPLSCGLHAPPPRLICFVGGQSGSWFAGVRFCNAHAGQPPKNSRPAAPSKKKPPPFVLFFFAALSRACVPHKNDHNPAVCKSEGKRARSTSLLKMMRRERDGDCWKKKKGKRACFEKIDKCSLEKGPGRPACVKFPAARRGPRGGHTA